MICPRCSVAEIPPDSNRCDLCGYVLMGARTVSSVQGAVADEVHETVQRELADRFELQVLVRKDRGSSLYAARDLEDNQLVSLRLIPRQGPVEGPLIHRFAQTATLAGQLRHPHLVSIRKHGITHSLLWYSADAVKSSTLGARLERAEPMALSRTLELLEQIASGLEYLHRNAVVHGGLGRETVLIDAEGWARVSDPGTGAAIYRAAGPGVGWEALLDLPCAAPELLERRLMGPAADQFSLAALAYMCLAGRPPFTATSVEGLRRERAGAPIPLEETRADLPPYVNSGVMRALRDDPSERFASVLDLVAVLGGAATRPSSGMRAPTGRPSAAQVVVLPQSQRPRRRLSPLLALAFAVVGFAGGAYLAWTKWRPRSGPEWAAGPAGAAAGTELPSPAASPPVSQAPSVTPDSAAAPAVRPAPPASPRPSGRARQAPQRPAEQPATLMVNATPWGSLYLDGRLVGNTPQAGLSLTPGVHVVRVVRDGFVPFERTITARVGDTLRLTDIVLQPLSP
jgi:serine/threonine-protein kinase